ncbi:hypothetical protein RFI_39300, partial [Reticulomyxa filosa]
KIEMIYQIVYQLMKAKTYKFFINYQLPNINYQLFVNCSILTLTFQTQEFNSFHITWKDSNEMAHKEPLNPYSITFKQGIQHVKHNLQMRSYFMNGMDELILFACEFDKCKPAISSKISKMNDSD